MEKNNYTATSKFVDFSDALDDFFGAEPVESFDVAGKEQSTPICLTLTNSTLMLSAAVCNVAKRCLKKEGGL